MRWWLSACGGKWPAKEMQRRDPRGIRYSNVSYWKRSLGRTLPIANTGVSNGECVEELLLPIFLQSRHLTAFSSRCNQRICLPKAMCVIDILIGIDFVRM